VLDRLGMSELAKRPPEKLSGGQKRKLELARAIIAAPDLLFLDEATLGLDVESRRAFWQTVEQLAADGTTVFLTTHYIEEAGIADRMALILVADDPSTILAAVALPLPARIGAFRNRPIGGRRVPPVHLSRGGGAVAAVHGDVRCDLDRVRP
jgi:ABC-type nitrate/sulfonate/bicarbonate transport system ATPase subunit